MVVVRVFLATCVAASAGLVVSASDVAAAETVTSPFNSCDSGPLGVGNVGGPAGGIDLGALTDRLFFFADGSSDANWQSSSKGYAGDVVIDGIQANERTSGDFAYAGTVATNASALDAWQGIVDGNTAQASASTGQTVLVTDLEADLAAAISQIDALPATAGYASVSATSLDNLNTQDGVDRTYVINVTSGFGGISSQIDVTGDAGDVFVLRWDSDANFADGYEGQVKFQSGGAIIPHGGLTPGNFVHVAGDINASGGGSTPPLPYPQGPRHDNGTGALIAGASDFSGGGFFTGYWLTTGKPDDKAETAALSNAIFVGGWYSLTKKFSMTSGTSGVHVCPNAGSTVPEPPSPAPAIDVEKEVSVDGGITWFDADTETGPTATAGANDVFFRFTVTNTGDVALENIELTDTDVAVPAGEVPAALAVGDDFQIVVGPFVAQAGQHENTATVTATPEGVAPAQLPPDDPSAKYEFLFVFENGAVASGVWDGTNDIVLADFSDDIDLGDLSTTTHISCSDLFGYGDSDPTNDGWSVKGAPDPVDDPGWRLAGVQIRNNGNLCLDGGDTTNGVTDTDQAHYIGVRVPPAIDIEKLVSVNDGPWFDADDPTGPTAVAGVDQIFFRFIVTNTGGTTLTDLDVFELANTDYTFTFPEAVIDANDPLPIGGSFQFDLGPFVAAEGQHFNEVKVTAVGQTVAPFDPAAIHQATTFKYVFRFLLADGTIIEGSSASNAATVPAGDADNETTVVPDQSFVNTFHVSCSDPFGFTTTGPDGWGEKGSPVFGVDNGPITDYLIVVYKSNDPSRSDFMVVDKTCGHGDVSPAPEMVMDQDPAHYLGEPPASIGDRVWSDLDGDGMQDPGEPGLTGVTVELQDPAGSVIATDVTDADGIYTFDDLPPGDYTVVVDGTTLPAGAVETFEKDGTLDGSTDQSVAPGDDITDVDFGYVVVARVGDYVWSDVDRDGRQDIDEPGIPGVTVILLDGGDTPIATTTTDGDGRYLFDGLMPGDYRVVFTTPDGFVPTLQDAGTNDAIDSDADPVTGRTGLSTLAGGDEDLTVDAGFVELGAIGDRVWYDADADGVQDVGEPGIPGVTVTLDPNTPSNPADDQVTTTDANGNYLFDDLLPGTYQVVFETPDGFVPSPANQTTDSVDSDPVGGLVVEVLDSGETNLTIDAGFVELARLGDFVWADFDGDGVQDQGEPGIAGVRVVLDPDTPLDPADDQLTTTDAAGFYEFTDLYPGTYRVIFTTPAGYEPSPANQGGDDAVDSDPLLGVVGTNLSAGEDDPTIDAGFVPLLAVGDLVWADRDADGIQDAGEPGIEGVLVTLLDATGAAVGTTTTDAVGGYLFDGLTPGGYTVVFGTPAGFVPSPANQGTNDAQDSDAVDGSVDVTLTATDLTIDAGFVELAELGDLVWFDVDADGIQDGGELGIEGVAVRLLDGAGAVVATDVTDADGRYLFDGLYPGVYRVEFVAPTGLAPSPANQGTNDAVDSDADPATGLTGGYTLAAGDTDLTVDAGYYPLGAIGDTIFADVDRDGLQDGGEPGLPGVTVELRDASGALLETAVTDADGNYVFDQLPPGVYRVVVDTTTLPAGFEGAINSADPDGGFDSTSVVDLGVGEVDLDQDFGYFDPNTVGDTVFHDLDGDGVEDAGDPGIAGVTVRLYRFDPVSGEFDAIVGETVTDATGYYLFDELRDGLYSVAVITSTLPATFLPAINSADPDLAGSDKDNPGNSTSIVGLDAASLSLTGVANVVQDFGYFVPASIGDRVWSDLDADGVQDAGEPGIPGVTVTLLDDQGGVVAADVTDVGGLYAFDGLAAGDYTVVVDPTTLPSNVAQTFEKDDTLDGSTDQSVSPGDDITDVDFGFVPLGSIGDYVWSDTDADGVQDAGESGIEGVTVNLSDGSGAVIATTSTDTAGLYLFEGLLPGDYVVEFVAPVGFGPSPQDQGGDDGVDSDADPVSGLTGTYTLAAGEANRTVDAGFVPLGSIGDYVWSDDDADGVQGPGESGIPGVPVTLLDDQGDAVASTTTDVDGFYLFDGLLPGEYTVVFGTPAGFAPSPADQGGDDALDSDPVGGSVPVSLSAGEDDLTVDAGFVPLAGLGDFVWSDDDGDGVQDQGESGIPGVTVTLLDGSGAVVATATTDAAGGYFFDGLLPGDYVVEFVAPVGFGPSRQDQGGDDGVDSDADPVSGLTGAYTLGAGEANRTVDAGFVPLGSIGDYVWSDDDADGIQDSTESGIPGVPVTLLDGAGAVVATDVTDADGLYLFDGLLPGEYTVVFGTPAGFAPSPADQGGDDFLDSDPVGGSVPVTLAAGEDDLTVDAGFVPLAAIGDYVWSDDDADGVQDPGESGIPGVPVTLLDDQGDAVASTTTDVDGFYLFDGLYPDVYDVIFETPAGFAPSPANQAGDAIDSDPVGGLVTEVLAAGETNLTIDAGFVELAAIGDFVWSDTDADGIQGPTEPGISGVTVNLSDRSGAVIATMSTDAAGLYLFDGLLPGDYRVGFVAPVGFGPSSQDQGGDDGVDSDADPVSGLTGAYTLAAGEANLTVDAGFVPLGSIGDFVWSDDDGDGVQGPGESGVPGVPVTLLDGSGAVVATTTTAADGFYLFDGLLPGEYTVVFGTPAGFAPSPADQGGDDALDSDPVAGSVPVSLAAGEDDLTVDAGFVPLGAIGDFVWSDDDADGIQDSTESGIAGITVTLLDGTGAVVATDVTDADGLYLFDGLLPGEYTVVFGTPAGFAPSPADQGGDDALDSDPVGGSVPVSLAAGEANRTVDAGFVPLGAIGDYVWFDDDADGIQDSTESGIAGITVTLLDGAGAVVATEVTDADGLYLFDGLYAGAYQVVFGTVDTGGTTYIVTPQDQGANDAVDSDADPATGAAPVIILTAGETDLTIDAGLVPPATITGVVTEDINDDDVGDLPLEGVTVQLYTDPDGDGVPDVLVDTTVTDADGGYVFDDLYTGDYVVVELNPAGYVDVADEDTTDDGDPFDTDATVDSSVPVSLTPGELDDGNDVVDRLPAGIFIVKTAGDAPDGAVVAAEGTVGETIVYTFVVTNADAAILSEVTITDPLPGLSAITCAGAVNGSIVLAPGESVTCTATYELTQADIDAGLVRNVATVTGERPGGDPNDPTDDVSDTDPAVVDVPQLPAVAITKLTNGADHVAAPGEVVADGSTVVWTYVVGNPGNVALDDVVVVDDGGTPGEPVDDFLASYTGGDTDGDGLLDVGEAWTFTASGTARAGQYGNAAIVTGNPVDENGNDLPGLTNPVANDDDFYFAATADIEVRKTVVEGADADCSTAGELVSGPDGTPITYCFVVTNTGNVRLDDVTIEDATIGLPPTVIAATLLPGDSATFQVNDTITGDLVNTVTATGTPIDDITDPANPLPFDPGVIAPPVDTDTAEVDETLLPAIQLTKAIVDGPTDLGDGAYEIVYDVVVDNQGAGPDTYVLDDELRFGDGITVLSASIVDIEPGTIGVELTWNGVDQLRVVTDQAIDGLERHTYRVTVTADALTMTSLDQAVCATAGSIEPGGYLNVASISSSSTTDTADACDDVPLPDITIAKSVASGPTERAAEPGVFDLTYEIEVTNAGPGSGRYDLADTLTYGAGITVLSSSVASADVTTDLSGWSGSGVVVADEAIAASSVHVYTVTVAAEIPPGTSETVRDCTIEQGEEGTGLLNEASVSGPLVDPADAEACAPLSGPEIEVVKTVVAGPTLVAATTYEVAYQVVVTNSGDGAGEYDLDDELRFGAGVTVVAADVTSADVDLSATSWDGTDTIRIVDDVTLEAGASHTYSVTARVTIGAGITSAAQDCVLGRTEDGTGLLNIATVTVDGVSVSDDACGGIPEPQLTITKTVASGPTLTSGGTYTMSYRVVVENTGDGPGQYDLVDVPMFGPAVAITSANVSASGVTLPSPAIWKPASGAYLVVADVAIAAGERDEFTMTFTTTIDPLAIDETAGTCTNGHLPGESEFFNRADVLFGGVVVDSDDACAPPPLPKLEIAKSVSPKTLTASATGIYDLVYTITVSNLGGGPTTYTLTDTFAFADGVDVLDVSVTSAPSAATLVPGFDGSTRTTVATAPLAAGAGHTYRIGVRVRTTGARDEGAFDCTLGTSESGTGFLNVATLGSMTAKACVPIPKLADLELTKAVSTPRVDVGDEVTFTIYVTNLGPAPTSNVSVKDVLPSGLTYRSHTGDGSYSSSTGIWTIGTLAVGSAATLEITVRVDAERTITNTAQVWTSDVPDPDSTPGNGAANEDDQDAAEVVGQPAGEVLPPTPPPATLPPTGGGGGTPVTVASWLVAIGGVLLLAATRRRGRSPVG